MKKILCVLVLTGSIGISADIMAGGRGHHHGHHFGGWGHAHRGWNSGNHHGRSHFDIGVYFGPGFGYSYRPYYGGYPYRFDYYTDYYGYPSVPYYAYPSTVLSVPRPVYIEREPDRRFSERSSGYWYYCSNPSGYYPYVESCRDAWQPVPAQPSSSR